jgi:hypothetical protein
MHISSLLKDALRITCSNRALWALSGLMLVVVIPAALVTVGMSWVSGEFSALTTGLEPEWMTTLRAWPAWQWVLVWLGALGVLVVTSTLTYLLQAGTIHGAALAADRAAPVTLREALQLGRPRLLRLIRLSLTLGAALTALNLLPFLLRALLGEANNPVLSLGQSSWSVLLTGLSLIVFIMVLAIAVEDVRAGQAARRAWMIMRQGWWAFLLVFALNLAPTFMLAVLIMPFALVVPVAIINPDAGIVLGLVCCAIVTPVGLSVLLFFSVFTTTLYTLVYRAAARLADAPAATPAAPGT